MELKDFIQKTIEDVAEGLNNAAENVKTSKHIKRLLPPERIEFDVSVVANQSAEGKAGVEVFGIGAGAKMMGSDTQSSRIHFVIPIQRDSSEEDKENAIQRREMMAGL